MRRRLLGIAVGLLALAAPAAAQAATRSVFMGPPPGKVTKQIQGAFSDVNAFFPTRSTVHVGDTVRFVPVGFHSVELPAQGSQQSALFAPFGGAKVSGANDAAGQPFWFNGEDEVFFNSVLFASKFGKTVVYNGSKTVQSGAPLADKVKPIKIKFKKAGAFTYFCNIHPGMKGRVFVKSGRSRIPTAKAHLKVAARQLAAAAKVAKGLANKTVPANTVNVGSAGPKGVEYFGFVPGTITVDVGDTVSFRMSKGSYDEHTATTGPGNPETEPDSYLGKLAASFQGDPPFAAAAVYPSEEPGSTTATLTPTLHGNGFWNSGVLDDSTTTPTLPVSNSVTFGAAGEYKFYCLIHPFMVGTVKVQ
jgi:plastocyanin